MNLVGIDPRLHRSPRHAEGQVVPRVCCDVHCSVRKIEEWNFNVDVIGKKPGLLAEGNAEENAKWEAGASTSRANKGRSRSLSTEACIDQLSKKSDLKHNDRNLKLTCLS